MSDARRTASEPALCLQLTLDVLKAHEERTARSPSFANRLCDSESIDKYISEQAELVKSIQKTNTDSLSVLHDRANVLIGRNPAKKISLKLSENEDTKDAKIGEMVTNKKRKNKNDQDESVVQLNTDDESLNKENREENNRNIDEKLAKRVKEVREKSLRQATVRRASENALLDKFQARNVTKTRRITIPVASPKMGIFKKGKRSSSSSAIHMLMTYIGI